MKSKAFELIVLIFCVLALGGCYNYVETTYRGQQEPWKHPGYDWHQGQLQIWSSNDLPNSVVDAWRRGYAVVGTVSFSGSAHLLQEWQLRRKAQEIGAHALILSAAYTHTSSGAIPITTPTSSTTYTSGTATAYGSGGTATAYGSSTSTTYGTQTTYVPFSVDKYKYQVLFLVRNNLRFGTLVEPPSIEVRREYETNQGVVVLDVRPNTPAFRANVLPGDYITSFAGQPVQGVGHFYQLIDQSAGKFALVVVRRGNKIREIEVYLDDFRDVDPVEMREKVGFDYGTTSTYGTKSSSKRPPP